MTIWVFNDEWQTYFLHIINKNSWSRLLLSSRHEHILWPLGLSMVNTKGDCNFLCYLSLRIVFSGRWHPRAVDG